MKNPIGGKFKDEESVSKFNEKISLGKNNGYFLGNFFIARKKI
jgi:hypothetical protein